MLIEAGSRERRSDLEEARQRFAFSAEEKTTAMPAWLALGLAGLFAYAREWLDDRRPHRGTHSPDHAGPGGADRPHIAPVLQKPAPATPGNGTNAPDDTTAPTTGHPHDMAFVSSEPALDYRATMRPGPSLNFGQQALLLRAVNDNAGAFELPSVPLATDPGRVSLPEVSPVSVPTAVAPHATSSSHPTTGQSGSSTPPQSPAGSGDTTTTTPTTPSKTNRAPTVTRAARLGDVIAGRTMLVGLGDLLLGSHDADGDELHVQNLHASTGSLEASGNGWIYTATPGAETHVTLTYSITDGTDAVSQTAEFQILSPLVLLTPTDDIYVGDDGAQQLSALSGNDIVDVLGGDDTVDAGDGDDHVSLGSGNDVAYGGAGDDIIFGGDGNDVISGGDGNDRLFGEAGNDVLMGDAGDDYLSGGTGSDVLDGGAGADSLDGDAGSDVLDGGAGSDVVRGGDGDDILVASAGDDVLDGGAGVDTLDMSAASQAVTVDLLTATADGAEIGHDQFFGIERFVGGNGDDVFILGNEGVEIAGGNGDDTYIVRTAASASSAPLHHDITDFAVGDRIAIDDYSVVERAPDVVSPDFSDVYSGEPPDNPVPIRTSDERYDDMDVTIVSVEGDSDHAAVSIWLYGHHDLVISHFASS